MCNVSVSAHAYQIIRLLSLVGEGGGGISLLPSFLYNDPDDDNNTSNNNNNNNSCNNNNNNNNNNDDNNNKIVITVHVNLDMTDSMGPGKLVRHMQNPLYTYDKYLISIELGPRILSVICKDPSYSGPSYPSSPVVTTLVASAREHSCKVCVRKGESNLTTIVYIKSV